MKSIKDFEEKGGCEGVHTLSYGSLGEHQQEMIIQQAVENLEDNKEEQENLKERSVLAFNKDKQIPQQKLEIKNKYD